MLIHQYKCSNDKTLFTNASIQSLRENIGVNYQEMQLHVLFVKIRLENVLKMADFLSILGYGSN